VYPWGERYREGHANVNETYGHADGYYLEMTTAVGMYPQGMSAEDEGLYDMSGNVWEVRHEDA
jgi:formylglycine-generating enzyme required for sulfatase activity